MLIQTSILAVIALSMQAAPETEPAQQAAQEEAATAETTADEAAPGPEQGKEAKENDENEIICRREAVVGSKFKKKICGTRKQWEDLANRARQDAQDMQRRGKGVEPVT